jgi:signal peptidase I
MMKKLSFIIAFLFVACLLTSCGASAVTTQNESTSNTLQSTLAPVSPPDYITALDFNGDFEKAKKFVEENDLSEFGEKDKANVGNMINAFKNDGYLIRASSSIYDEESFLYLGPQYGKVTPHISYRLYTGDVSYLVTVWHADEEILKGVKELYKDNFELGYFIERNGLIPENWQHIEYNGTNLGTAKNLYMNADGSYLRFWIDGTHHVTIQATEENRENLIAFVKTLTFEKVALEKSE